MKQTSRKKCAESPSNEEIRRIYSAANEGEERYRLVFENTPVGVLHFDKNGIIRGCNKKFLQIMDTSTELMIGLDLLKFPDINAVEAVKCALNGKIGYYNGYYSSTTSKKVTPLKAVLSPILSPESEIIGGIGIYEDISENIDAENRLQYQFQFERVISNISTSFVNSTADDIDLAIENALKLIGQFFNADRCYIFLLNRNRTSLSNTHEWHEQGVETLKHKYQNFPVENLLVFHDLFNKTIDHLQYSDVSQMPVESANFQSLLFEDGVASILMLPLVADSQVIGLFGYEYVKAKRLWSLEEITLLKIIGEVFSSALARKEAEHQRILIEAHRQQSEKADSLGRMAEAIAKLFNNQLQLIIGNLDLQCRIKNVMSKNLDDAMKAAMKAAEYSAMLMAYLSETHGKTAEEKSKLQTAIAETLPRQLEGGLILVIDDEEMLRFITSSMLQHFNFKIIEASCGDEALQIFSQQKDHIRLVICDLLMPGMNGWQTIAALRNICPGLPVILASSYDEGIAMKGLHTEIPQAFLRKPFNSGSLQEAIRIALRE